jgi:hypothetical protein
MKEPFKVQNKHTQKVETIVDDEWVSVFLLPSIHVFIFEDKSRICAEDLVAHYEILDMEVYRRSLGITDGQKASDV